MNKVISQLQFGEQHCAGVAHQGIKDAFPHAEISSCGIYCRNSLYSYLFPEFALVSMKTAYTLDKKVVFRIKWILHLKQLNEVCNLKTTVVTRQCTTDQIYLPVHVLLSEEDVGDLVLIKMDSSYQSGQAICEGILIIKQKFYFLI